MRPRGATHRTRRASRAAPLTLAVGLVGAGVGTAAGPEPGPKPASAVGSAAAAGPCSARARGPGITDPDLYCIDLVPAPDLRGVAGTVLLGRVPSPFGVAVTRGGEHLYDLAVTVEGLPDPSTLGPYRAYVAWVTTPLLRPMVKLGELRAAGAAEAGRAWPPGVARSAAGRAGFDKFLVMVSAERSADVAEREGRMVLRGTSASMRLQPHDLPFLYTIGDVSAAGHASPHPTGGAAYPADPVVQPADKAARPAPRGGRRVDRAEHAGHGAGVAPDSVAPDTAPDAAAAGEWTAPPMHPGVPMPPALAALRPSVAPFLPGWSATGRILAARPREVVALEDGDTLELTAGLVRRTIRGRTLTMYGFNGQYPGPLIRVPQGATVIVDFRNRIDLPTAVHWHGVRLDNRFDGVPGVTQDPVPPGGRFIYEVRFPDAGIYWYHPHHREDIQQDLGLYGNMLVDPPRADHYGPAHREEVLMLDDLLIAGRGLVPYGREAATHALMGRFGNVLLVNGEPELRRAAKRGEVVRFFLTNASNTRTYNLSFDGARMKVVGSDVGRFEREAWVDNVVLAPAERYIVDARFEREGAAALVNRVQAIDHLYGGFFPEVDTLVRVGVSGEAARPDLGRAFGRLREHDEVRAEIARFRPHFGRPPDRELLLTLELDELPFPAATLIRLDSAYFNPVEWSGTMPMMNWAASARQAHWILREPATGRENMGIAWRFRVGDVARIRLTNDRDAAHAMQHPIHVHGQRFLILAVDGVPNDNLVWKDTLLLPVGSTADILVEFSNPGRWMLHCHIAEHLESGMKMVFVVDPAGQG